ncbi:MAG: SufS family cysteine desulfurase [Candidatus Actinomarinales bacterium]|nr:MAG: SufS family cysteine desulfurase [Candidatus Actinomarinales bacterium]
MINVEDIKKDFPIFKRKINNLPLNYLDSGATSQKPKQVLKAMNDVYTNSNANVHRGTYILSAETTEAYENVRNKCKEFINAPSSDEIIFTRGTTDGFNLLAQALTKNRLDPGDEILLSEIEHHANIIPWQLVAKEFGLNINFVDVDENFEINFDDLSSKLNKKTKIVSLTGESNIAGTIPNIKEINSLVKEKSNALFIVDGAQLVPHRSVDVQDMGIDFITFSGHKMLGPTGIGVVWGKAELLNGMEPVFGGGDMIEEVYFDKAKWAPIPHKFEAGTPPYVEAIGLGAAIDYLNNLGMDNVEKHSDQLRAYGKELLKEIDAVKIIHSKGEKAGCTFSLYIEGVHATDLSIMLDTYGIAVRAGHHCVQPFHRKLGIDATFRATCYIYNQEKDLDNFKASLEKSLEVLI